MISENDLKDIIRLSGSKKEVSDLVDNYIRFLETGEHPKLVKIYRERLEDKPADAEAEAVAFHFFKAKVDRVQVNEIPNTGGVDFRCQLGDYEFIAEITHLDVESVSRKSGVEEKLSRTPRFYDSITDKLYNTVSRKASQMLGYDCPGILVIACKHSHAGLLLGPSDAENLLIGDTKIGISIPKEAGDIISVDDSVTDLENSSFLRWNQEWEVSHRSISSILLCHISGKSAFFCGILHPDPIHRFSPQLLPSTPFVRLKKWPPKGCRLETEWIKYEETELVPTPFGNRERLWYDSCLVEQSEE